MAAESRYAQKGAQEGEMRGPDEPYVSSMVDDGKLVIKFSYPNTDLEPGQIKEAVLTDAELLSLFQNACEVIGRWRRKPLCAGLAD